MTSTPRTSRRLLPLCLVTALVAALVLVLAPARPASAAVTWTDVVALSDPTSSLVDVDLAVNAQGRAVVAWTEDTAGFSGARIFVAVRDLDGWQTPVQPAPPSFRGAYSGISVGIDPQGRGVVVWSQQELTTGGGLTAPEVWSVSREPAGAWSAASTIGDGAKPRVLIDSAGRTTAAFLTPGDSDRGEVVATTRPLGGSWATPVSLTGGIVDVGDTTRASIDLAADVAGDLAVAWTQYDRSSATRSAVVNERLAGGPWRGATTLATNLNSVSGVDVAKTPLVDATAVSWFETTTGFPGAPALALRAPGADTFTLSHPFPGSRVFAPPRLVGYGPSTGVAGSFLAAGATYAPGPGRYTVQTTSTDVLGTWEAPQTVPQGTNAGYAYSGNGLRVAGNDEGNVVMVDGGDSGDDSPVVATDRVLPAQSSWPAFASRPELNATPGTRAPLDVGIDRAGRVTVAMEAYGDTGSQLLVSGAMGSPPPPSPGPPAPPPPVTPATPPTTATATAPGTQSAGKGAVSVQVSCTGACTAEATGSVAVPRPSRPVAGARGVRRLALRPASAALTAAGQLVLRLRLKPATARAVRAAVRHGVRVKATIRIVVTPAGGTPVTTTERIRLKR